MKEKNILEQRIAAKEEYFSGIKAKLEKILGDANGEYSSLLSDFRNQVHYIQNDNTLSKEGKKIKGDEIKTRFINKVNAAAGNHFEVLETEVNIALKEIQVKELEKFKGLNTEMLPQLIYINSMLSYINSLDDAELLESVFNYASVEGNFSDEIVNMIYIKARNLIGSQNIKEVEKVNEVDRSVSSRDINGIIKAQNSAADRTKINSIVSQIDQYKKDYTKELSAFRRCFVGGANNRKYPNTLYMCKDPIGDFRLPGEVDINNPWNV